MSQIVPELRQAWRRLLRAPGFTVVSIVMLALGIGATVAIFSVLDAVLLRPLPYPQAEQLAGVEQSALGMGMARVQHSDATYFLYRQDNHSFQDFAIYEAGAVNITGTAEPERVASSQVSASLFPVLRVSPLLGRTILAEEDRPGGPLVAMLSEAFWRRKFGGDPSIIGKVIQVNGRGREVVGIMPSRFAFPSIETAIWIPFQLDPANPDVGSFNYDGVARLRPGATLASAEADLDRALQTLPDRYPGPITHSVLQQAKLRPVVHALRDDVVGDIAPLLWVLFGTVAFVLLIACANVANLSLVRAEARQKELAVRTALGARRADVLRIFMIESGLLAVLGGAVGLALAWVSVKLLVQSGSVQIPRLSEIGIDARVIAFALLITAATAVLFGAFPILRYGTPSLAAVLKEGGRGSSVGRERHRARNALVIAQIALALVLLSGAGLMARSAMRLRAVKPGFDPSHLLTLRISLPAANYKDGRSAARFFLQAVDRVSGIAGVESAGAVSQLPLTEPGSNNSAMFIEGIPVPTGGIPPIHQSVTVSDGYLKTMRIPLIEGRGFEHSTPDKPVAEALVSAAFAKHYWKGESAIGHRVRFFQGGWHNIVGVVSDIHLFSLEKPVEEMIYLPTLIPNPDTTQLKADSTSAQNAMTIVVRTAGDPAAATSAVRAQLQSIDPSLPIYAVKPMSQVMAAAMQRTSVTLLLLAVAASIALVLGSVGIYGVISYVVSLRTREIGVRMALGAQASDVSRMVTQQGVALAAAGVGLGLVGALTLTRFLRALLFGVAPNDPLTLGGVAVALFVVAMLASWLPARRAARIDPILALRAE